MYIVFDIGGTTSRFASSLDGETIAETKIEHTPQNLDEAIKLYKQMVDALANGQKVDAMAGGVAGPLNPEKTMLVNAPHLKAWINKPLSEKFRTIADCTVNFENDTGMAALGEAIHGAGSKYKIVAYLAVGTGVGGCLVVEGNIAASAMGFEPGHMFVSDNETLEEAISGTTIMQKFHKQASEVTDPAYWREFEEKLMLGLNNLTVMWSPDIIVLGGGVVLQSQLNLDRVALSLYKKLTIYPKLPKIVRASLGDHSGLIGSLTFLKNHLVK